jgi:putative Holliday junction resolvase
MRRGVRLGVDVGEVRVGVARCDPGGVLATPVATLPRDAQTLERIADLAQDNDAIEIVVGLPRSLKGHVGPAARLTLEFAEALSTALADRRRAVSVRLIDERLTTVSAQRVLRERGRTRAKQRAVVDQAAAVVILQHALDTERSTGLPPGQEVRQMP